jgi:hypothetical protein
MLCYMEGGVHGRVVKFVDFKPFAPHRCGFESRQELLILLCEEAIQLAGICGFTQVPACAWNNARRGTWGLPPPVELERRHMTYTVSVWRNTHLNKQTWKGNTAARVRIYFEEHVFWYYDNKMFCTMLYLHSFKYNRKMKFCIKCFSYLTFVIPKISCGELCTLNKKFAEY